jgi:hypothetical protein
MFEFFIFILLIITCLSIKGVFDLKERIRQEKKTRKTMNEFGLTFSN